MIAYEDNRGWMYFITTDCVRGYSVYFAKPGQRIKQRPHSMWRSTEAEAQRDLDELAKRKGWRRVL